MSKGREGATLGQIFWGHSSVVSMFSALVFPVLLGPTYIFLLPRLVGSSQAAWPLRAVDRVGRSPPTPIHRATAY